ncbi:MAG: riboflavin synthase [Kiloniellales bacterium]
MFTGIVTNLGRVRRVERPIERPRERRDDVRFTFETGYDSGTIETGASIACSGVCLTVVDKGSDAMGGWFAADVSAETLSKTTLGSWREGTPVNFERALRLGDELGGHLVSGHVDGVAEVVSRAPDGGSQRFVFEAPAPLARFIAAKGSVALDGVSLTVNQVEGARFGVNIIPHTAEKTTFGALRPGSLVNLEIDLVARYLQRLAEQGRWEAGELDGKA